MSVALVVFGTASCTFLVLPFPASGAIAFLSFVVAAAAGMFVRISPESLRLGADLLPRPAFPAYRPDEIRRIDFAPDPAEDYAEGRTAAPLCEATISIRRSGRLRLIVTVEDARRLREWAVTRGIEVIETAEVLGEADRGS
jgi:hypothetical protein